MEYKDVVGICAGCGCNLTNAKEIGSSGIFNPNGPDFELCIPCFEAEEEIQELEGTNFQPDLLSKYFKTFGEERPKLYDVIKNTYI